MELKLSYPLQLVDLSHLLIVPYGIETRTTVKHQCWTNLLIVPYGIETQINRIVVYYA